MIKSKWYGDEVLKKIENAIPTAITMEEILEHINPELVKKVKTEDIDTPEKLEIFVKENTEFSSVKEMQSKVSVEIVIKKTKKILK